MSGADSFGERLRALRQRAGLSQSALARTINYHPSQVSKAENGAEVPSRTFAEACDAALRADGALVGLVPDRPEALPIDPTVATELVRRLRLSDVDGSTLDVLACTTERLCEQYAYRPATGLRREAGTWLRYISTLLDRRVGLREHRELLVTAGWLALLVGCLEYDSGLPAAAEATRMSALHLGTEAGHADLVAWSWEMSAWFAHTNNDPQRTADYAETGQRVAGRSPVTVQLAAHRARALARMGDQRGVHEALDQGHALLQQLGRPSNPGNHFMVDPDKFDFYAMDCFRVVGDNGRATAHAHEVLRAGQGPDGTDVAPMRMAEARIALGCVAVRHGDLDEAVEYGVAAFRSPRKCLPSLLHVAGELDTEMRARYPDAPQARQFRDHLHAVRQAGPAG